MAFSEIVLPFLAGLGIGLALGWLHSRTTLRAYQAGVRDGRVGSCWVKGEVNRTRPPGGEGL